jgi:hypothetical protein
MVRLIILLGLLFDGAMLQFLAGCSKQPAPPPAVAPAPAPEPAPAPPPPAQPTERG